LRTFKIWLEESFKNIDKNTRELAFSNVIKKLEKHDIDPKSVDEDELSEMVAHEVEKIKTFGTGAALGMGTLLVLDMFF